VTYSKIRVEPFLDDQARHVVLNAPKANLLDAEMMAELNGLLDEIADRKELKLLCFSGEGDHFCFGASVPEHVKEKAPDMLASFHGMFLRLVELSVPTVAAVKGRCLGGGMELACFCNWVVAHPKSVFAQPEIQLAVLPPVASLILPFKIGQARADTVNLSGRNVDAEEAERWGLVDSLAEDPVAAVEQWAAEHIAPKSAAALRFACRASRWHFNKVLREELEQVERLYLDDLMATHDANEGLAAFLEKRKPTWTNE